MGARHVGHVLHQAEDRHVHHGHHVEGLANDHLDEVLRGRDHHDALDGKGLEDREGHVAGSRRHVDEQVVKLAPGALLEELPESAGNHGPAPHDWVGLVLEYEIGAHDLDAALGDSGDEHLIHSRGTLACKAQHLGDGGAGDVCVQDAHASAGASQLDGQASADKRLAHAALAGNDPNHMVDLGVLVLLEAGRSLRGL